MRLYLDNCCLNRPFDDQSQDRIRLESEAIRLIFQHIEIGEWILLGSDILNYEIEMTPDYDRRIALEVLVKSVHETIRIDDDIITDAESISSLGITSFDAYHLAFASHGNVDVFLTVDDKILTKKKKIQRIVDLQIDNPLSWISHIK